MDRAGGDARGRMLQPGETDRGHPSGHRGGPDRLFVSADGIPAHCAGGGAGGGRAAAASVKEGKEDERQDGLHQSAAVSAGADPIVYGKRLTDNYKKKRPILR